MRDVMVRHARKPAVIEPGYRFDIEGLRAIAILLVAGYHVWGDGRVSGGVDVFLMISGFFVGGGLLRRMQSGQPFALGAYVRKLGRRLLPPLLLTLAVVVVGTWLWLPRSQWSDVAGGVLASATYSENWRMALNGQAYAVADPLSSPVQHIWSLSVQGQIFVALPILLLLARALLGRAGLSADQIRGALVVGISVLAFASLVYAVIGVRDNQAFAYFDTAARLWEYLAGTLAAVFALRWAPGRGLSTAMGWAGLAAILATGVVLDGRATFPGVAALLPIGGAALLIFAGLGAGSSSRVSPSRFLAWRPLAVAGGYAYEFYLWHWVVLVFALAATGRESFGWLAGGVVLLISGVLAWAGRGVVGWLMKLRVTPGVQTCGRRALVPASVWVLTVLLAVPAGWLTFREMNPWTGDSGLDAAQHPGALTLLDSRRWPTPVGVPFTPGLTDARSDWPIAMLGCPESQVNDAAAHLCVLGDPLGKTTVVLAGNSHAVGFGVPLDMVATEAGVRVEAYFKVQCPLGVWPDRDSADSCAAWNLDVLDRVKQSGATAVFTAGTRSGLELEDWDDGDYVPDAYMRAWQELIDGGTAVAPIRNAPRFAEDLLPCLETYGSAAPECSGPREGLLGPSALSEAVTGDLYFPIDLSAGFCDDLECPAVVGNVLVYIDGFHITATYGRTLAPLLAEQLSTLEWWP